MRKVLLWVTIFVMAMAATPALSSNGPRLTQVRVDRQIFNPSRAEACSLTYSLKENADVTVEVFTTDFDLVRRICEKEPRKPGENTCFWDGRDQQNRVVPDEAYFFCIKASFKDGTEEIYDPTVFSGGDEYELSQIAYDKVSGALHFSLPRASRVLMRAGLTNGPLIATVMDWEPRPEGENVAYWTGFDEDGVFDARLSQDSAVVAMAFALPDNSVITAGSSELNYFSYIKGLSGEKKPLRKEEARNTRISQHYYYRRAEDRAPRFRMEILKPQNPDQMAIRVSLDEEFKDFMLRSRFEVCLFLDGRFLFEEEEGYTPFNMAFNTRGMSPGEHYLTVVLSTYLGQAGSRTVKIRI